MESAFSGGNKIASLTTPAGLTTTNLYDANGFQVQTIGLQIGRTNSFGYTTDGLIGVWTNELGLKRGITWNNLLQLTGVQYPDGTSTSIDYNRLDPYIGSDRLGNATIYLFDRNRRLGTIWF